MKDWTELLISSMSLGKPKSKIKRKSKAPVVKRPKTLAVSSYMSSQTPSIDKPVGPPVAGVQGLKKLA